MPSDTLCYNFYMIKKCINPKNVNYVDMAGTKKLLFSQKFDNTEPYYTLKCGSCLYCMSTYSTNWATRLMLESQYHKEVCFITLTYNDENLPKHNSLAKRDTQLFLKRLRKSISPKKIRYFLTGEYGGRRGRAHYHMVLFGHIPNDLTYLKHTNKKEIIYTSPTLEKLWGNGFVSIGLNITLDALKYVAKYLAKLSNYDPITQAPPFSTQSNRKGIGYLAFDPSIYETDGIYINGRKYTIPRYYDKIAEQQGIDLTEIKSKRDKKVKAYANTFPTYSEKLDYKNYVESQGYNLNHLFLPSSKTIKKRFLEIDKHGEIDYTGFKLQMKQHLNINKKLFLEQEISENDL